MTTAALTDAEVDAAIERLRPSDPTKLARAIYRAGFAAGLARAPAVPREPTQAMIAAGANAYPGIGGVHLPIRVWRAMYDAAPAQDQPAATPDNSWAGPVAKCRVDPPPAPAQATELEQRLRAVSPDFALAYAAADTLAAMRAENARLTRERDNSRIEVKQADGFLDGWRKRAVDAKERAERLAAALRELVGVLEIGAVMPDAIGKHLFVRMDGPELTAARAALAQEDGNG